MKFCKKTFSWRALAIFQLIASLLPLTIYAQSAQWASSINVGGTSGPAADWILDVITTKEGNYFAVGFAKEDESSMHSHNDVPSYALISPNGQLLGDGVIEDDPMNPSAGRLANVVEAGNDFYFAVGYVSISGQQSLLVRVDKTSLSALPIRPVVTHTNPAKKVTQSRLTEISYVPGTVQYLLCSGWVEGNLVDGAGNVIGTFPQERWLVTFNFDGSIRHQTFLPLGGEQFNTSTFEPIPNSVNGDIYVYGASNDIKHIEGGGSGEIRRWDSDIVISSMKYNPTTGFQGETTKEYNSITQGPRDNLANAAVAPTDIFYSYPPTAKLDQYPYGPKYVGTSFERSFPNGNEPMESNGYYIEDWSDGSDDVPYSMVVTQDAIVVSALLNRLIMWDKTNDQLGYDCRDCDINGVDCRNCTQKSGLHYNDGGLCCMALKVSKG